MECEIVIYENMDDLQIKQKNIQKRLKKKIDEKCVSHLFEYYIYLYLNKSGVKILIHSTSYQTRATDLMKYLSEKISSFSTCEMIDEQNSVDNRESYCLFKGNGLSELGEDETIVEQIKSAVKAYNMYTDIIDARTFFRKQKENILTWNQYAKVNLPRFFVSMKSLKKSMNLDNSDKILLRTLENESGIILNPNDDKIIMIGTTGETYDMPVEKFEELYQVENPEKVEMDVEKISTEYKMKPVATLLNSGEEINLLDFVDVCQLKKINVVYARQMEQNMKVFSTRITGTNQYYLGNGEREPFFLTVDKENTTSVHIVNQEAFEKSYRLV